MTAPKPKPGDVVIVTTDNYYAAKAGDRAVIDRPHYGPGKVCAGLNAHAFWGPKCGPPTDRNPGRVSVSGGPFPAIDPARLVYAGKVEHTYWCWSGSARKDGGVDYRKVVDAWLWDGVE